MKEKNYPGMGKIGQGPAKPGKGIKKPAIKADMGKIGKGYMKPSKGPKK